MYLIESNAIYHVVLRWEDIYLHYVERKSIKSKSNQDCMASLHGGDITVNGFSNICNFHRFFRGSSNILASNIYWVVAFKIFTLFESLNEESPKRIISKKGHTFMTSTKNDQFFDSLYPPSTQMNSKYIVWKQ